MIFVRGSAATTIPAAPPPVSFAGTIVGTARAYIDGGAKGAGKAVGQAIGAISGVPIVGDILGDLIGSAFETKSVAGWNRTLGRIYRAAILGQVPALDAGAVPIVRTLKAAWLAAGDKTGAQFWDRVVSYFGVPTEKGGTKEGYGAGAPAGSKQAEATPGFSTGLSAFLAAVG